MWGVRAVGVVCAAPVAKAGGGDGKGYEREVLEENALLLDRKPSTPRGRDDSIGAVLSFDCLGRYIHQKRLRRRQTLEKERIDARLNNDSGLINWLMGGFDRVGQPVDRFNRLMAFPGIATRPRGKKSIGQDAAAHIAVGKFNARKRRVSLRGWRGAKASSQCMAAARSWGKENGHTGPTTPFLFHECDAPIERVCVLVGAKRVDS